MCDRRVPGTARTLRAQIEQVSTRLNSNFRSRFKSKFNGYDLETLKVDRLSAQ